MDGHMEQRSLSVEGLPVTSTVDAPAVSLVNHARLAIDNGTDASCNASITTVTIVTPEQRLRIDDVYVYALPDYDEVDLADLTIGPGDRVEYEVSFVGHPVAPIDQPVVEIEVLANGTGYVARSQVTLVVRTRRQ
jgi:hypothetical protein